MSFDYQVYLASREWAVRREAVRKRSGNRCERTLEDQRCVGQQESVHHLTYARIGNELLEDLLGVCNDCHKWLSGKTDVDPLAASIASAAVEHPRERSLGDYFCESGFHSSSFTIIGQSREGPIALCSNCNREYIVIQGDLSA